MSLILDALKKLDREKLSRRKRTTNIALEILRADPPRPRKKILYFAAVSVTAVAAAAITYGVMVKFGFLSKSPPPVAVKVPAPTQKVAPAPHPPEPVREARNEVRQTPPNVQIPPKIQVPPKVTPKVEIPPKIQPPAETKIPPVEHTPTRPATTPPVLNLSGILWSEDPSKRLALINDTMAAEGSEIRGVKIVEIRRSSVRLSYNGQAFEISLYQ